MKFIPGMRFINNTMKNTKLFKRGVVYKLNNIKRSDKGVVYTFLVDNKDVKDVTFASFEEADNWLETIQV